MNSRKLSENMKKVLCGISHYPEESNKMLAKRLSVNTSTISTSRQRLNDRDLIHKRYIPDFFSIDTGIVMVTTGKFRYHFPNDVRETVFDFVSHPAIPFLIASDEISWLVMGLVPSTQMELMREPQSGPNERFLYEMTFDVNRTIFDTEDTKVWRYFDYGYLLCKTLNVDISARFVIPTTYWAMEDLKTNERTILKSLLDDPKPSDFQRSQYLGISHPTITKIRKSLISNGIIKSVIKPDLAAFGFSIFSWFNIKLEGKEIPRNLLTALCSDPNNILCVNNENNIFILSVYMDMKDLLSGQKRINDFMAKAMISFEDIEFNYFSLENPSFALKLTHKQANQIFTGVPEDVDAESKAQDQEKQLVSIIGDFLPQEGVLAMINEAKGSLGFKPSQSITPGTAASMILEFLIEPKYLSSLEKDERTALQAKLIKKLNGLKSGLGEQEKTCDAGKKKSVMIVEDSKAMTDLLQDIFADANFNVLGAVDNGEGAFNYYKNLCEKHTKPDVVLMDIFIKGLNGVEATRMIKDYDPSACIVVLTSSLDSKIKTKLTSLGVEEYLIKPVTKVQLISSLEQTMAKRKGRMR